MDAVAWAAGPEGQASGIRVINLSLAGYVDPEAAGARRTAGQQAMCVLTERPAGTAHCNTERGQPGADSRCV
jgi:hypothetical protein